MKVAIIGAGPSGLACALQLERLGVTPDIFEIGNRIGEKHEHISAVLQIMNRPIDDPLKYLKNKYNINLVPYYINKKIVHYGPTTKSTITGDLGYFFYRGTENHSLSNQLASMLNTKVTFNTYGDYKKLKKDYDYVVVATGKILEAKEAGIWNNSLNTQLKGAIVVGEFETDTLIVWINRLYCNSGYAYLTPFNNKSASLVLIVTGVESKEIDKYWDLFIKTENLRYNVAEYFTRDHSSGFVYPHKVDNVYFVGNAAGAIDPFLGFGIMTCIVGGVEAANSIVKDLDFEKQIKNEVMRNLELGEFRKILNTMDNDKLDLLVKAIGLPGVNTLVYNTNIDYVKYGSKLFKKIDRFLGDKI